MYVCLCHALTEADVRSAEAQGAGTHGEVFQHFGVEAQCGHCLQVLCGMLCCETTCERHPAAVPTRRA